MSWTKDKEELQTKAREIDSSVILTTKNSLFWKMIATVLYWLSFGYFKKDTFLKKFATTLGNIQAYPEEWDTATVESVIIHESRHTAQARWCGLGIHPLVGLPIMSLLYLLLPIPMFGALFRTWFELDAERKVWKYYLAKGVQDSWVLQDAERFAILVAGPSYLWAFYKPWNVAWYTKAAQKVINNK
jgi:hypothetical protein